MASVSKVLELACEQKKPKRCNVLGYRENDLLLLEQDEAASRDLEIGASITFLRVRVGSLSKSLRIAKLFCYPEELGPFRNMKGFLCIESQTYTKLLAECLL